MERYPAASRWAGQQKIFLSGSIAGRTSGVGGFAAARRRARETASVLCLPAPTRARTRDTICAMGPRSPQRHVFNPTLRTNAVQMPCQEMRDLMPIRQTGVRFRSDEYCFRGGQIGQKLGECRQSSAINSARLAGVNRTNQALTRLLDHPGKFDCQLVKVGRDPPNAVTSEGMDVRRGWACYSQHVQNIDEQLAVGLS